jgi:hypothetical protein
MTAQHASALPRIETESIGPRLQAYWEALTHWVHSNSVELGIAITAAVIVFLTLSWLKRIASKIARESEHRAHLKSIIARTLARTSKFFRVMVSIELVNQIASAPAALTHFIDILFTIAIVVQIAIWLREIILGLIERRAGEGLHENDTLQSAMVLIRLLVSFVLFAVAAIVVLDNLGVNVTGLVAGLGVGGIAIGLAAQGIFSDLFAAISIIFDKPFRRGDTVSYDNTTARVEVIGMKSTRLRALTGEEKIISNSKLLEKEITNNTLTLYRRVTFVLTLVYQTPPALARRGRMFCVQRLRPMERNSSAPGSTILPQARSISIWCSILRAMMSNRCFRPAMMSASRSSRALPARGYPLPIPPRQRLQRRPAARW